MLTGAVGGLIGGGVGILGAGAFYGGLSGAIITGAVGGGLAGGGVEALTQLALYGQIRNPQLIGAAMLSGVVSGGVFGAVGYGVRRLFRPNASILPFRDQPQPRPPGMTTHHLIEERFADVLDVNPNDIPSVLLSTEEHLGPGGLTTQLRQQLPYGQSYEAQAIWNAYKAVYEEHPDWLAAIWPYFQGKGVRP